jgi:hypothetical protein
VKSLPDDLEDLLDAERDIDAPPHAQRQRIFTRLEPLILPVAIGTGALATSASVSATAEAAAGAGATTTAVIGGALRAKVIASVLSAAVVGAGVGAAGHAYFAPPRAAPAVPAASVVPAPKAPPPPAPEPERAPEPAPTPSAAAPPASASRTEERARSAGSLRAERLLIETASAALVRGDNASAIAALRQHARTFPKGALAEEREVLLVKALAASGDDAAAKRRAKDFKTKFPGSLQQDSVDKAARPK